MTWVSIKEYQKTFSDGSRPCARTVKRWIENNDIVGKKIGGRYYIFQSHEIHQVSNPLALKVLLN